MIEWVKMVGKKLTTRWNHIFMNLNLAVSKLTGYFFKQDIYPTKM